MADPFREIRILSMESFTAPNEWLDRPVTRMELDIGAYEDISSADVPHFTDQLLSSLPGLWEHKCSIGERGGFVTRLKEGTYTGHIVEHVALELQYMIGHRVVYGKTRGSGKKGCYTLVFEHVLKEIGLRSGEMALDIVRHAFAGTLIER